MFLKIPTGYLRYCPHKQPKYGIVNEMVTEMNSSCVKTLNLKKVAHQLNIQNLRVSHLGFPSFFRFLQKIYKDIHLCCVSEHV